MRRIERGAPTTNEELAAEIQRGKSDLYADLWEKVKAFVTYMALCRYAYVQDRSGVDLEDLIQSGFLGLVAAVNHFDPERGSFLSCLAYHLKRLFNNACGVGWERVENDPIHSACSLDAPIDEGDPDGATFGDLLPAAVDTAGDVEERVYMEQLHQAIEKLLSRLSPTAADVIRATYFDGEPLEHIAERYGTTAKRIASRRDGYMYQLRAHSRRTPEGAALRRLLDENTNFFYHVGVQSFHSNHESAPEHLTILRDQLAHKYTRQKLSGKDPAQ